MATPPTWADLAHAPADDGAWLVPRMGTWGTVGAVVGLGWEASAVVPHQAEPLPDGRLPPDAVPPEGSLDAATATLLRDVLARHTTVKECRAALWEGYGWVEGSTTVVSLGEGREPDDLPPAFPRRVLAAPRLCLPHRAHLVFAAHLDDLRPLPSPVTRSIRQSPTLFWPVDQSWLLATEVDLDATIVGGSTRLVDDLVGTGRALRVGPDDTVAPWDPWSRAARATPPEPR
jgi:hypothetical protein